MNTRVQAANGPVQGVDPQRNDRRTNGAALSTGMGELVRSLRATFDSGATRPYTWRSAQLDALLAMAEAEEAAIVEALNADLGKPRLEGFAGEVADVAGGTRYIRKHLKRWMKPQSVSTPLVAVPASCRIQPEPLGVALIISPWNYPFSLTVNPLVGALAAGNCAIVKPSEHAPHVSALLASLLPKYLDADAVRVVEGGVEETTALLQQRFDHVFFTGSTQVGRIVMQAAAKHLTPVTLELGGKSPCVIDESADLPVAARRVVWGKFYNAGQTCVAPDYLLVHERVHDAFLALMKQTITEFWGEDPQQSRDLGRIVNVSHLRRLQRLLPGSGDVVVGGRVDEADRYFAPTLLTNVPEDAPVMQDEIFGPILPVLPIKDMDEAVRFIHARPKPLAAYLFASSSAAYDKLVSQTSSGGFVLNHVILHVVTHSLPFGGVGESGMGAYHGRHSFDTFSHRKAVLKKGTFADPSFTYPPYDQSKERWLRRLL